MDIAEVAKNSGIPASTLRYYEETGLIASIGRSGLRRLFSPSVLERLALIVLGRSAGFSLDEIAQIFTPEGKTQIDRQLLADKADELDKTIRKLSAMRDGLRHAVACPAPSHWTARSSDACWASPQQVQSTIMKRTRRQASGGLVSVRSRDEI